MSVPATCQICGRAIKLVRTAIGRDVIAHHGYQQPHRYHGGAGSGWRTASCLGARFEPYEVTNSRIPHVIDIIEKQLARDEGALAEMLAEPPASMRYDKARRGFTRGYVPPEWVEVPKPADAGDAESIEKSFRRYTPNSYEALFSNRTSELRREIERGRFDHKHFTARYADWKSPADRS